MKIAFSWDDGALDDLHLMELHRKHAIPGMFFVPTENKEDRAVLSKEQIALSASDLISFGGHTQHHTYLTSIPIQRVEEEIRENKVFLEDVLGQEINHFCLPGGQYNQEILSNVYQQYETCRTADTMAFSAREKLLIPTFHFYPRGLKSIVGNSFRHRNYSYGFKALSSIGNNYFDLLRILTDEAVANNEEHIMIWGHSWELEEYDLWNELDSYMAYIKTNYGSLIVPYDALKE